jgi:hypothetical protein
MKPRKIINHATYPALPAPQSLATQAVEIHARAAMLIGCTLPGYDIGKLPDSDSQSSLGVKTLTNGDSQALTRPSQTQIL